MRLRSFRELKLFVPLRYQRSSPLVRSRCSRTSEKKKRHDYVVLAIMSRRELYTRLYRGVEIRNILNRRCTLRVE